MLLAIDVGNSNIVVGVFDGERLVADFRLHTDAHATGDELGLLITGLLRSRDVEPSHVAGVVVSSVVPTLSRSIEDLAQTFFGLTPMVVGPGVRTGMRILYDDPRQVGADRISRMRFDFELADPAHLESVLTAVKRIDSVYDVYRILPGKGARG